MTAQSLLKRALSVDEFCQTYGLVRSTAYLEISEGRLQSVTVGRRRLIPVESAEKWLASKLAVAVQVTGCKARTHVVLRDPVPGLAGTEREAQAMIWGYQVFSYHIGYRPTISYSVGPDLLVLSFAMLDRAVSP